MDLITDKKILIVDDEHDLRDIISQELEYYNANIYQASNVKEAKALIETNQFDLIISDIRMPGESGIDLLRFVRDSHASKPPLILITGFADIEIQEAFDLGADDLIQKPFSMEKLLDSITFLFSTIELNPFIQATNKEGEILLCFDKKLQDALDFGDIKFGRRGLSINCNEMAEFVQKNRDYLFSLKFKDESIYCRAEMKWKLSDIQSHHQILGLKLKSMDQKMYDYVSSIQTKSSIPSLSP